jgi:hypothetical protein
MPARCSASTCRSGSAPVSLAELASLRHDVNVLTAIVQRLECAAEFAAEHGIEVAVFLQSDIAPQRSLSAK